MKKKNIAIILAAGSGSRMGAEVPKQYLLLKEKPILAYSLQTFSESPEVDGIILMVASDEDADYCEDAIINKYGINKIQTIANGGKERYDSVYRGLLSCDPETTGYVLIHDAARPFANFSVIRRTLDGAKKYGGCIAAVACKDTCHMVDGEGLVSEMPDRSLLRRIQTPQTFSYPLIMKAYEILMQQKPIPRVTDDCQVAKQMMGAEVFTAEGSEENIKITTPFDLRIAESILDMHSTR